MTTPHVVLTPRYAEAVQYASELHAGQTRKSTNIAYISHLLGVSSLVLEAGGDEDMAIAALLHDGPEDRGGQATLDEIRACFGDRVAHIVEGCSDSLSADPEDKAPWKDRKVAYLEHLKDADDDTLAVSLADKLHNARAIATDLMVTGPSTWDRFNASPPEILWYYESIVEIARRRQADPFLVTNLQEAVNNMVTVPKLDADQREITRYATTYNAYERWFGNLGMVSEMLEPLEQDFRQTGRVSEHVGVDALRAWLFVLIRSDRFNGSLAPAGDENGTVTDLPENPQVRQIVEALNERELAANPSEPRK